MSGNRKKVLRKTKQNMKTDINNTTQHKITSILFTYRGVVNDEYPNLTHLLLYSQFCPIHTE